MERYGAVEREWLNAEQGDAEAQYKLAERYSSGDVTGLPGYADTGRRLFVQSADTDAEAAKWYRLAAEQGHRGAQTMLGNFYESGRGVTLDYAEAAKYYRMDAEDGNRRRQHSLGALYASGNGVPQDDILAYKWLYLSAEQGYTDRINYRSIAERMTAADISEAEAMAREWLEAKMAEGCLSVSVDSS